MIALQNISKYYYTDTSVTQALRKINLEFQTGEFVAITGESGSGKSTLLNIISGMDAFDDGELYYDGEPTFQFDAADWEKFRRDHIGFIFQNYNLIGAYSALENVISALLIMGVERAEAQNRAETYLKKVGLYEWRQQKASELSSGQKQRLSIARALAKETSVIVADEPTGNLDSETGKQIIELLKEVSENKLVLMVTHNYDEAAPYVTRKITLHDGEVVVDVKTGKGSIVPKAEEKGIDGSVTEQKDGGGKTALEQQTKKTAKVEKRKERKCCNRVAWTFACMNSRTQKARAFLFRVFFLFTAVISFIFIGQLYKNADDTYTKDYDDSVYYQKNDSRLSAVREDGEALTQEDIQKMKSVRNVVQVDAWDAANDINYYLEEGTDYQFVSEDYGDAAYEENGEEKKTLNADRTVALLNEEQFMRSSGCISQEDLSEGKLPESRYEIVLYAEDSEKLGEEYDVYFTSKNITGLENFYHHTLTVVGLLKEETSQVYFHEDLCQMLSIIGEGDTATLEFCWDEIPYMKYMEKDQFYVIVGDDLEEDEAIASKHYYSSSSSSVTEGMTAEELLLGDAQLTVTLNKKRKGYTEEMEKVSGEAVKLNIKDLDDQGGNYLQVSETLYEQYFARKSTQASVYIKNYTKTDKVIRALTKLGYKAVSTYRISSTEYNSDKVMDRLVFIGISLGILLVLIIVEILILRSLMKIKIKDYYVLKSMGMEIGMLKKISLFEMSRYCIEAMALTAAVMLILYAVGIPALSGMMIYYGVCAYITFFFYNFLLECVTVWTFNRLLKGRMAV